eukprot:gene17164-18886_t
MEKIQVIANEKHESIKVTIDYSSIHENNRMPVLDVEQWVQPIQCNGATKSKILHSHYMKPMASKHVLNKHSALSQESKTNILVADLVRCSCGENYFGETARSISEPHEEHMKKLERKNSASVFHQHMLEKHNGVKQALSARI